MHGQLWVVLSLACLVSGLVGCRRRRVWGLYALLAGAGVVIGAAPSVAWLVVAAAGALPLVLCLPLLLRADRAAALVLVGLVAGAGLAGGRLARLAPRGGTTLAEGRLLTVARSVAVTAELVPVLRELRVTIGNATAAPLALDLPDVDDPYPPLVDPLIRIEAFDSKGQQLHTIKSFGCGAVYQDRKVELYRLAPGQARVYRLKLPAAWYPGGAVLPYYSHGMMMNRKEVARAPRPVATRRVALRVVYDNAAVRGSWRDDLSTGAMASWLRVRGQSPLVHVESQPTEVQGPLLDVE
jgi:hypothetical protein